MNKYVCIHGHFYQPPRENPWLESIETQESAYPYHDWNERITSECYAPNAASRILDRERRIVDIVNNYSKISFNFGPTLLSWMEQAQPDVYQSILLADILSQNNFSGHGAALAQAYNHLIMPLANRRDKETQIIWGIADFEFRYKRKPEGMWLPETAVDLETLELLAKQGIRFTILAPRQAARTKPLQQGEWKDVSNGSIDPQMPYVCHLPSGKSIVIFFYDGPISQEIAFSGLLKSGVHFAERLLGSFPDRSSEPRLVHIATDGETYGHHHQFGDMALSYCLHHVETNNLANLTIYPEYLEKFPPTHEVQILENSSWSCVHGVERWRTNCGCHSGMRPEWKQEWRGKLREALDWLRDLVVPLYEKNISTFGVDPWDIRNSYIQVILNRNPDSLAKFFGQFKSAPLSTEDQTNILMWMEIQRNAMLMYTSCGWFFDEISGIETAQIIQYAARVIQLVKRVSGADLEAGFLEILKQAPSNIPEFGNGAAVYELSAKSAQIDLKKVAIHWALTSLFEKDIQKKIYAYRIEVKKYHKQKNENMELAVGQVTVRSEVTHNQNEFTFAAFHSEGHNLNVWVKEEISDEDFKDLKKESDAAFAGQNTQTMTSTLEKHFGVENYSLWDLLSKSDQERILNELLDPGLKEIESLFGQIQHWPVIQAKKNKGISLPKVLAQTAEFVLNRDLWKMIEAEPVDLPGLQDTVDEILHWSFEIDHLTLNFIASRRVDALMEQFSQDPENIATLKTINALLKILSKLPVKLNLWKSQNLYFFTGKKFYPRMVDQSKTAHPEAKEWVRQYDALGDFLELKSG